MGFRKQEYQNELLFLSQGDLPHPGIEPGSPTLWVDSYRLSQKPKFYQLSELSTSEYSEYCVIVTYMQVNCYFLLICLLLVQFTELQPENPRE